MKEGEEQVMGWQGREARNLATHTLMRIVFSSSCFFGLFSLNTMFHFTAAGKKCGTFLPLEDGLNMELFRKEEISPSPRLLTQSLNEIRVN